MEPRRCGVHGLVVGADDRCVVCRRGDPELGTPKTSREWPLVIALSFFAALIVFSGGYWLTRKLASMSQPPTALTATLPIQSAEIEPETVEAPVRFATTVPRAPGEASPPPARPTEMTQEELETLKRGVKVTMYSTGPCSLCSTARTFLKSRKYKLTELDIDASPTDKVLLESVNPAASVPTFDIEGKVLIGYDRQSLDRAIEEAAKARQSR